MTIANITWNFRIAKYVIETYSRPFDLIYDSCSESNVTRQISEELFRFIEPNSPHANPLEHLASLPDNLLQLVCLDAKLLLHADSFKQQQFLQQILRVLSPEGYCSVLISDGVRFGKIVPNGFQLVHRFLANGFKVASVNEQRTSHELPFQLLPHQYLAIFQKPAAERKRIANINHLSSLQLSLL